MVASSLLLREGRKYPDFDWGISASSNIMGGQPARGEQQTKVKVNLATRRGEMASPAVKRSVVGLVSMPYS